MNIVWDTIQDDLPSLLVDLEEVWLSLGEGIDDEGPREVR